MRSNWLGFLTVLLWPTVMGVRRVKDTEPCGPLVIGVDPAGKGADSTTLLGAGALITKIEKRYGLDTMEVADLVAKTIREEKPVKVNINIGGLGVGVDDRPVELAMARQRGASGRTSANGQDRQARGRSCKPPRNPAIYTFADRILTMTDSKRLALRDLSSGEKITHKLAAGDDAALIVVMMKVYRVRLGRGVPCAH